MKKVICLFSLMFALVLMNTSCTKPTEDNNPIPVVITYNDLVGNWQFVSLNFNGTLYTTCNATLKASYVYCNLSFNGAEKDPNDLTKYILTLYSDCSKNGNVNAPNHFTLSNDVININDGDLKFEIQNVTDFDGKTLVIKLLTSGTYLPTGGIYTLQK